MIKNKNNNDIIKVELDYACTDEEFTEFCNEYNCTWEPAIVDIHNPCVCGIVTGAHENIIKLMDDYLVGANEEGEEDPLTYEDFLV